jgi:hypothetical protein
VNWSILRVEFDESRGLNTAKRCVYVILLRMDEQFET